MEANCSLKIWTRQMFQLYDNISAKCSYCTGIFSAKISLRACLLIFSLFGVVPLLTVPATQVAAKRITFRKHWTYPKVRDTLSAILKGDLYKLSQLLADQTIRIESGRMYFEQSKLIWNITILQFFLYVQHKSHYLIIGLCILFGYMKDLPLMYAVRETQRGGVATNALF